MSRICRIVVGAALALSIAIAIALTSPYAHAAPRIIPYQGRLTDAAGTPLNGSFVIRYSIYTVASGGSAAWSDTQTVSAANGLFSSTLGAGVALPSGLFANPDLFLGIQVGTDPEMAPRQQLLPVPFAIRAEQATTVSLVLDDHDFAVTFFNGSGTWWAVIRENGTILRQSGGFTSSRIDVGIYQVDNPGLDESQAGVTMCSFNAPGFGVDPVLVSGFANGSNGIFVRTFGVGVPGTTPGAPGLLYQNLAGSQK